MTTFGHRIAAVCDNGMVYTYDSVTGVLRLSLSPDNPVHAIRGSPDGSTLFCVHKGSSITVWDLQTGGLIHTFFSEWNPENIAVSLNGRYLACGLSDGSVKVWEVINTTGDAVIGISSPVTRFCWLEPEERLAVSRGSSVDVWDTVAGTVLYGFAVRYPTHRMVYSQKLGRLAVMARLTGESAITIIDLQAKKTTPSPSYLINQNLTCFTFSQTTGEPVCGMEAHGLQLFNSSTQRWRQIEYTDTMTCVSPLPNGTVAANFVDSGIQLLSLDGGYTLSQQPAISALTAHAFDQGKVIITLSIGRNLIELRETATMSRLLTIPIPKSYTIPAGRTHVLCASLENHMTVYCFEEGGREFMQLWKLNGGTPEWVVRVGGLPLIGGISPSGTRILTFHGVHNATFICAWNAINGQLEARLRTDFIHPLDISFDSETKFYSYHDTYRIPFVISSPESEARFHSLHDIPVAFDAFSLTALGYLITRRGPLPFLGEFQRRYYDVDDAREWVVSDSKRICWIPPGYIGSVQPSYCWAGHSLIMVGKDKTLRKLTLREPT